MVTPEVVVVIFAGRSWSSSQRSTFWLTGAAVGEIVTVTISPTAAPMSQKVDLWLDDQDRPAKMTTTTSGVTMQVTYSDWGAPVTITAPPADQVGSLKMPGA